MTRSAADVAIEQHVTAASAGDGQAVTALLAELRPLLVRYCRARLGRAPRGYAEADDIAQDILFATLNAVPGYRGAPASFLPFVYGIARNKVADHYRERYRDVTIPLADLPDGPDTRPPPEQHALDAELSTQLGALLGCLSAPQREVLVLRLVVGLSTQETAAAVGMTPGTVRVTQHRALAALRALIAGGKHTRRPRRRPAR